MSWTQFNRLRKRSRNCVNMWTVWRSTRTAGNFVYSNKFVFLCRKLCKFNYPRKHLREKFDLVNSMRNHENCVCRACVHQRRLRRCYLSSRIYQKRTPITKFYVLFYYLLTICNSNKINIFLHLNSLHRD